MLKDLVKICRSYRRFYEDISIPQEELTDMVDTVRLTGCTANCQPLKYRIIRTPEECAAIFPCLLWAGALKDWDGPEKGERPSAYIVILCDLTVAKNKQWDEGIAAQTLMLSAAEKGYGGCMIGSFHAQNIREILNLDKSYVPVLVVAIGEPEEKIVLEDVEPEESTNYYRDEQDVHYVPKRKLKDIVFTAEKK